MSEKTIETGFVVNLPKGKVIPTKFVRYNDKQAIGIDPNTGRDSWIFGKWTIDKDIFLTGIEREAPSKSVGRVATWRRSRLIWLGRESAAQRACVSAGHWI